MAALEYRMDVTFTPETLKPGETVQVTARLQDVKGEIASVHLAVPEYGVYESLSKRGENVYAASPTVPWGAPYGNYRVKFFARSPEGEKGPEVEIPVRVGP